MKSRLEDGYFDWLCNQIYGDEEHHKLLELLFEVPYEWTLPMDENRAKDGIWLRKEYCSDIGMEAFSLNFLGNCRMLEMLIALAIRIENDTMYDPDMGDRTSLWFWFMIGNLGLYDMDDESFNRDFVTQKLEKLQQNLFPLKKNSRGENLEISHRKDLWLMENFDFDE